MSRVRNGVGVVCVTMLFVACGGEPSVEKKASALATHVDVSDQYLVRGPLSPRFKADVATLGGEIIFQHKVGIAIVSGLTDAAAATVADMRGVVEIQRDAIRKLAPSINTQTHSMALPASPVDPTSAAFYPFQWNMRAIGADVAWAAGELGSANVTVAVLDTGIDYDYPDLWGRVDLDRSTSFVPIDDLYVDAYFPGKHHVTDLHAHGTHVAATIASNALLAAGVTSQTTLMGVKVCSFLEEVACPDSAIIQGVLYAVDHGADVINMSLGGAANKAEEGRNIGFYNKVFNAARAAGVTVVVAAGNESTDLDHNQNQYAAYCDNPATLCVSATGPTHADDIFFGPFYEIDAPASYTNYGRSAIDVAAPGGNDGGYVWAGCSTTSLLLPFCGAALPSYTIIGMGGTSMASPHVAGLAAMVVGKIGRRPARVISQIKNTADDLGIPGVDPYYGAGRINVPNAL